MLDKIFRQCFNENDRFTHVFLVPWLIKGGADLIAVNYIRVLSENFNKKVCVILTEDVESPWLNRLPKNVKVLQFGKLVKGVQLAKKETLILNFLCNLKPLVVHNINSHLGWELFLHRGRELSEITSLYASFFCEDYDNNMIRLDYAYRYLNKTMRYLEKIFVDNERFANTLRSEFDIQVNKIVTNYTPALIMNLNPRNSNHKTVLWAGRLDKQKRPDILLRIAKGLPEYRFMVFGMPCLNHDTDYINQLKLCRNIEMGGDYDGFSSLPLEEMGVYLYTSQWDGLPVIILEAIGAGLPVVAPDVGGISEIINEETGFLIRPFDNIQQYIAVISDLLEGKLNPIRQINSAKELILKRHSWEHFINTINNQSNYFSIVNRKRKPDFALRLRNKIFNKLCDKLLSVFIKVIKYSVCLHRRYIVKPKSCSFSIDIINDEIINEIKNNYHILKWKDVKIWGWAADPNSMDIAKAVHILIDGIIVPTTYKLFRPDVAKHFKNEKYEYSGFSSKIPSKLLPIGEHNLSIRIVPKYGGRPYEYVNIVKIVVDGLDIMLEKKIYLSVIIPTYNPGQCIYEAIESVEKCHDPIYEIIIVNDGTDNPESINILADLKLRGYRVIDQSNYGPGYARNTGIAVARGKYILPLDDDNRIESSYIEKSIKILELDPSAAVIYGNMEYFGDRNGVCEIEEKDFQKIWHSNCVDTCAIFRKSMWGDIGGYDTKLNLCEDWDFWIGALEKGYKFFHIPEVMFYYCVRSNSRNSSDSNNEKYNKIVQHIVHKHHKYYSDTLIKILSDRKIPDVLKDYYGK